MKYPVLYKAIIALLKFDDIPPIPAVGYAASASDDPSVIYFACPIEKKGYAWNLVAKWDFLEDVAPQYVVPNWEKKDATH